MNYFVSVYGVLNCKSLRPHFEQTAKIVQDRKINDGYCMDCTVETGWPYFEPPRVWGKRAT